MKFPSSREAIEKAYPTLGKNPKDCWIYSQVETDYTPPTGLAEKCLPYYGYPMSIVDNALDAVNTGALMSLTATRTLAVLSIVDQFMTMSSLFLFFPASDFSRAGRAIDNGFSSVKRMLSAGFKWLMDALFCRVDVPEPAVIAPDEDELVQEKVQLGAALTTGLIFSKLAVTTSLSYFIYSMANSKYNQFGAVSDSIAADPDASLMTADVYFYFYWANFISGLASDPFEAIAILSFIFEKLDERFESWAKSMSVNANTANAQVIDDIESGLSSPRRNSVSGGGVSMQKAGENPLEESLLSPSALP